MTRYLKRIWRWEARIRPVPLLAGACVWAVLRFTPTEAIRAVKPVLDVATGVAIVVGLAVFAVVLARRDHRTNNPEGTDPR